MVDMESIEKVPEEECQQDFDGQPRKLKRSSATSKPELEVGYLSRARAKGGASDRWTSKQHSSTQN
eukprot:9140258-Lingulodinium_polyedra.AAC.1